MNEHLGIFDCFIDIEANGDNQRKRMQAPRFMIEQQFTSLLQQAAQASNPVKVKLSRMAQVYDEFGSQVYENGEPLMRELYIVFTNSAYEDCEK